MIEEKSLARLDAMPGVLCVLYIPKPRPTARASPLPENARNGY